MVKVLENESEFQPLIESEKLTVIDFYADWCGPCRMIAPKLEEFSQEFTNVNFAKVNVDNLQSIAQKCSVKAMPTFKFFKKGQEVAEVVGANLNALKKAIEDNQ